MPMKFNTALMICLLAMRASAQTFHDVQPIFLSKCATCHRPGEAAPFSLITYEDVSKRTGFIKRVITSGFTPPWQADPHYRVFANDHSLTPQEKEALIQWIDKGAPKGEATKISTVNSTAYGRPPDMTLKIDSPFLVPGDDA